MNKIRSFFYVVFLAAFLPINAAPIDVTSGAYAGGAPYVDRTFYGWKALPTPANSVTLSMTVSAQSDFHIGVKCANAPSGSKEQWLEFVIGGWGNTHSAVRVCTGDSSVENFNCINNYDIYTSTAVGSQISNLVTTGAASSQKLTLLNRDALVIPNISSPVDYVFTIAPEAGTANGIATLTASVSAANGTKTNYMVLSCKGVFLNQTFNNYSFRSCAQYVVSVKSASAGLSVSPSSTGWGDGWIKNKASDTSLTVSTGGVLLSQGGKDASPTFSVQVDPANNMAVIFSKTLNKYLNAQNLQLLDPPGTGTAVINSDTAKLLFNQDTVNTSVPTMFFTVEGTASSFKLKSSVAANAYLAVGADNFARLFVADPAKSNKYMLPVTAAAATTFYFEPLPPFAPINVGDVVTIQLSDGSYWAVDSVSNSVVSKQTSSLDPATHFKIDAYAKPLGALGFGFGAGVISTDDSKVPSQLKFGPNNYAGISIIYDPVSKKIALGYRGLQLQQNSSNPGAPLVLSGVTTSSSWQFNLSAPLTVAQKTLEGVSSAALATIASAIVDFPNKFTPAFALPNKTPDDWKFLVNMFCAYVATVSKLPGWTAPSALPGSTQSLRDVANSLLQTAANVPGISADIKAAAQAMIVMLTDQPVFLADPATPPAALSVNVGDCVALNASGSGYLVHDASGRLSMSSTSFLSSPARFIVRDYNKATGRICLGFDSSYLRLSNDAKSFVVTGTKRFIDIVRDATNANKFSFAYTGAAVSLNAAGLGLPVTAAPLQSFIIGPVLPSMVALSDLSSSTVAVTNDTVVAGLQTIYAAYKDLLSAAAGQGSLVSSADWLFFANMFVTYLSQASALPSWPGPAKSIAAAATLPAGTMAVSEYASMVLQKILASVSSVVSSDAKALLVGVSSLFSPVNVGDSVAFSFADGSYLCADASGSVVPLQTSTLNVATQFKLVSYKKDTGDFTLSCGSQNVCVDEAGTPLKLMLKPSTSSCSVFNSVFDLTTKQISFGLKGGVIQKNPTNLTGPVIVANSASVDGSRYLFNVAALQSVSKNSLQPVTPLNALTLANAAADLGNQFSTAFNVSPRSASDWKYLVDTLSMYVNTASLLSGWTAPSPVAGAKQSLRDMAVALYQTALKDSALPADSAALARTMIAQLQDMPVFLIDPTTPPPALSVNVNDVITFKISDGVYLARSSAGVIAASSTHILDPLTHFSVRDYNKVTGRICLGFDSSYIRFSVDATSLVVTGTKRFVDIVRDATNVNKFAFAYAGSSVSFTPQVMGVVTTPVATFEVSPPLAASQRVLEGLHLAGAGPLTIASIQSDIQQKFDPAFAALGTIAGDWKYFVNTLVAYLARAGSDVPSWASISIVSSAGTLPLKEYAIGVLSSMFGQFSVVPGDVQQAAKTAVANLQGGQVLAVAVSGPAIAEGAKVLLRMPSQDLTTSKALVVDSDGSVQSIAGASKYLSASHITIAKYDAAAKTIKLSLGNMFFDKTTGKFTATSLNAATPLTLNPVKIGGVFYQYLDDGASSKHLNVDNGSPAVLSFGSTGTVFDIVSLQPSDCVFDAIADPATTKDIEQTLVLFSKVLDQVATDASSLSLVVGLCDAYCQKAMTLPGWGVAVVGSQLAGAAPRDYVRTLFTSLLMSPGYSGVTADLKASLSKILANGPQFVVAAPTVVPVEDASLKVPDFASLDGDKGVFARDLVVFDNAVKVAYDSTKGLTAVFAAMNAYVTKAAARLDWLTVTSGSSSSPKDLFVGILTRVKDTDWHFTGLTNELRAQLDGMLKLATDATASYVNQISQLDSYAVRIIDAGGLTSSGPLSIQLQTLMPSIVGTGTAVHRALLLTKIETYYDKTIIPALQAGGDDDRKNAWAIVMFSFSAGVLNFDATTLDLLDEKLNYLQGVLKRRLSLIDLSVQASAMSVLLDPFVKKLAGEFVSLIKATPASNDERSKKLQKILSYLDHVVSNLYDAQQDLQLDASALSALTDLMKQIWIASGLKASAVSPVVAPKGPVVVPLVTANSTSAYDI